MTFLIPSDRARSHSTNRLVASGSQKMLKKLSVSALVSSVLMSAVASRDGREIVRALEALRGKAALERDADGRYLIKGT